MKVLDVICIFEILFYFEGWYFCFLMGKNFCFYLLDLWNISMFFKGVCKVFIDIFLDGYEIVCYGIGVFG